MVRRPRRGGGICEELWQAAAGLRWRRYLIFSAFLTSAIHFVFFASVVSTHNALLQAITSAMWRAAGLTRPAFCSKLPSATVLSYIFSHQYSSFMICMRTLARRLSRQILYRFPHLQISASPTVLLCADIPYNEFLPYYSPNFQVFSAVYSLSADLKLHCTSTKSVGYIFTPTVACTKKRTCQRKEAGFYDIVSVASPYVAGDSIKHKIKSTNFLLKHAGPHCFAAS